MSISHWVTNQLLLFRSYFLNFFLAPASPGPLIALRVGLALILIIQALLLSPSLNELLSSQGFIQGELTQYLRSPYTPTISWFVELLRPFHISEASCIYGVCSLYLLSLLIFALGIAFRGTSILVWFLHWTLMNTAEMTTYGVDLYAHVYLFYLMWMPAGGLDWSPNKASPLARLSLRVLQIHLCITYLCSGLEKAQGEQWWNGELLWRALNLPIYRQFEASWLVNWPMLLKIGGWATLVLEMGYCVFIWPKKTRKVWIMGMIGLHLGIAAFLGLHLFGLLMCVLTLALFAVPDFYKNKSITQR